MGGGINSKYTDEGLMSSLGCDPLNQSSDLILEAVSIIHLYLRGDVKSRRVKMGDWKFECL